MRGVKGNYPITIGICKYCKQEYFANNAAQYINHDNRIYCSQSCRQKDKVPWNKGLKGYKAGKEHYNWKGGITEESVKLRTSSEYLVWRKKIFSRDWFTCQMSGCGYKGKKLEAHHIVTVKENKQLVYVINNGITLCTNCHKKTRNREDVFKDYFTSLICLKNNIKNLHVSSKLTTKVIRK